MLRNYFFEQIRVFFIKLNTFLIYSLELNNVRIVTKIFIFFLSLSVILKSDNNLKVNGQTFESRDSFYCIDLIFM